MSLGLGLSRAKHVYPLISGGDDSCDEEECGDLMSWNDDTCECECNDVAECEEGYTWDTETCRCARD